MLGKNRVQWESSQGYLHLLGMGEDERPLKEFLKMIPEGWVEIGK